MYAPFTRRAPRGRSVCDVTGQAVGPLFAVNPHRDDREDSDYGAGDHQRGCGEHVGSEHKDRSLQGRSRSTCRAKYSIKVLQVETGGPRGRSAGGAGRGGDSARGRAAQGCPDLTPGLVPLSASRDLRPLDSSQKEASYVLQ